MSCFDKEDYKLLKKAAKQARDVYVYSDPLYCSQTRGLSIAFMPAIENSNCRMLHVAISYCSPEDEYKRKHGKYQALRKLSQGNYVDIPLASLLRDEGPQSVAEQLFTAFTVED